MVQTFEEFLAEWRNQALPTVKGRELESALEGRARELTELALLKGFAGVGPDRAIEGRAVHEDYGAASVDALIMHEQTVACARLYLPPTTMVERCSSTVRARQERHP